MESKSRIFSFKVLSAERCAQLVGDAEGAQWKSPQNAGGLAANSVLELDDPERLARARRALEGSLQRLTYDEEGEPRLAISSISMIRFGSGNHWARHRNEAPLAEPRYAVICFLSDDYGGGETVFPGAGVSFKPKAGDAIVYPWSYENEAQEVTQGEKYVLSFALCDVSLISVTEPVAASLA